MNMNVATKTSIKWGLVILLPLSLIVLTGGTRDKNPYERPSGINLDVVPYTPSEEGICIPSLAPPHEPSVWTQVDSKTYIAEFKTSKGTKIFCVAMWNNQIACAPVLKLPW